MKAYEFWEKYSYLRKNTKTNKSLEILIPNDIFKKINDLRDDNGQELSSSHKCFAFAVYTFCKTTNAKGTYQKISDIKEVWGYSSDNKSLNNLIKRDGILDRAGITGTKIIGLDEFQREATSKKSTKIQYKDIEYDIDTNKGNFFRIYADMMLGCMLENKKLGVTAFYIYAFICYKCQMKGIAKSRGNYEWEYLSISYIHKCLGLSEGTIKTNIKALLKYKMINPRRNFRNKSEEGYSLFDANQYFPCVELTEQIFNTKSSIVKTTAYITEKEYKWVNRDISLKSLEDENEEFRRLMEG